MNGQDQSPSSPRRGYPGPKAGDVRRARQLRGQLDRRPTRVSRRVVLPRCQCPVCASIAQQLPVRSRPEQAIGRCPLSVGFAWNRTSAFPPIAAEKAVRDACQLLTRRPQRTNELNGRGHRLKDALQCSYNRSCLDRWSTHRLTKVAKNLLDAAGDAAVPFSFARPCALPRIVRKR